LSKAFHANENFYFQEVKAQIENLKNIQPGDTINLWFEHDLFCQVNMWFVIHFLRSANISNDVYRVMPPSALENVWEGFGRSNSADLKSCFEKRILFSMDDLMLGN
jgi:hypothetical protein